MEQFFPHTWAEVYGLAYCQLADVVNAFCDGELNEAQFREFVAHLADEHYNTIRSRLELRVGAPSPSETPLRSPVVRE